ncbi:hypothetical protein SY88_23810 [Clostridiales bacterium PH28_bin88]|nr:hypothetical protein SY88_23810 [Clostridiales bacterium PH28_bin88]
MNNLELARLVLDVIKMANESDCVKIIDLKPHIKVGEITKSLSAKTNQKIAAQKIGRILRRELDMEIAKRQRDGYWVSLDQTRIMQAEKKLVNLYEIQDQKREFVPNVFDLASEVYLLRKEFEEIKKKWRS